MSQGVRRTQDGTSLDQAAGAALVEFAIVLPFILVFFFGVIEIGRLFSQIVWYSGLNYEALISGANSPANTDVINSAVDDTFSRLLGIYNSTGSVKLSGSPVVHDLNDHTDLTNRTVTIQSSAFALPVLRSLGLELSINFSGRLLAKGGVPIEQYSSFANPNPTYNCSNQPGVASLTPCTF